MNTAPALPLTSAPPADEADALLRLRQGDLSALDEIVLRWQVEAVRAAYVVTRDRALAVFVRLVTGIRGYDQRRPFAPYLFRSVMHEALKLAARRDRDLSLETSDHDVALEDLLPDWGDDPARQADQRELRRIVWDAMGRLPAKQRAVAAMRFYLEWSEADIAQALEVPVGTVKWRLHDARQRLKKLLAPYMSAALSAWLGAL